MLLYVNRLRFQFSFSLFSINLIFVYNTQRLSLNLYTLKITQYYGHCVCIVRTILTKKMFSNAEVIHFTVKVQ